MEDRNYLDLIAKAQNGALTAEDMALFVVLTARKNEEVDRRITKVEVDQKETKTKAVNTETWILQERSLMDTEATVIDKAIKKKALKCVGGKNSPAYNNNRHSIFRKVCMDIHLQIKRNYGLIDDRGRQLKYTALKVKYLNGALAIIEEYDLPVTLANEIDAENEIGDDFE